MLRIHFIVLSIHIYDHILSIYSHISTHVQNSSNQRQIALYFVVDRSPSNRNVSCLFAPRVNPRGSVPYPWSFSELLQHQAAVSISSIASQLMSETRLDRCAFLLSCDLCVCCLRFYRVSIVPFILTHALHSEFIKI